MTGALPARPSSTATSWGWAPESRRRPRSRKLRTRHWRNWGSRHLRPRTGPISASAPNASLPSACIYAQSSCAASSRSRTRLRCASSRASPWSSDPTVPANRMSPTGSSGPPGPWPPRSFEPRSRTTSCLQAAAGARRRISVRSSCSSTTRTGKDRSRSRSCRSHAAFTVAARASTCSTARPSGGSISSSCSPTSGSEAVCTRSSGRAAWRRFSAPNPRSDASCSRRRLRPLALQATAAERAEKLRGEISALRARVAELDLDALRERLEEGESRRTAALLARRHADGRLDSLLEERRRAEEELADAAGRREAATAVMYRLRSARERLELRRESAQALLERLRVGLARPRRVLDGRVRAERETLREQARLTRERLQSLERALAEREGLPPAARALAEEGEKLALSLLDVEPGRERAVAAALGHRAPALVAEDARAALALAERARAAGLGSVVVLTREPR